MASVSAKIFDLFRNLKSDAVPRGPRVTTINSDEPVEESNVNDDTTATDEPEKVVIDEPEDELKKEKKAKFKTPFFKNKKDKEDKPKKQEKRQSDCTVNTQATGSVINIVNSKGIRWGNDYYMGTAKPADTNKTEDPEEAVEKCNDVLLLMEAQIRPEHEYLDEISNNLGNNWKTFFIRLGILKGFIETMEINAGVYGVTEARYKLLRHWINDNEGSSLGKLATHLWQHGDRALVKRLAIIYKKNKCN